MAEHSAESDAGPIGVWEGLRWHLHSEPVCADPECRTYFTHEQMAEIRARGYVDVAVPKRVTPPAVTEGGAR